MATAATDWQQIHGRSSDSMRMMSKLSGGSSSGAASHANTAAGQGTKENQAGTNSTGQNCNASSTSPVRHNHLSYQHGHSFIKKTFHKPTNCHYCGELLWGLMGQGYICEGNIVNLVSCIVYLNPWFSVQHHCPRKVFENSGLAMCQHRGYISQGKLPPYGYSSCIINSWPFRILLLTYGPIARLSNASFATSAGRKSKMWWAWAVKVSFILELSLLLVIVVFHSLRLLCSRRVPRVCCAQLRGKGHLWFEQNA